MGYSERHPLIYLRSISLSFHPCLTSALTFRNRLFCNKQPAPAWHEQMSLRHCYTRRCYTCPCWVLPLLIQRCFKCMWLNGCFPIQAFVAAVSVFSGFSFACFVISLTSEFTGLTVLGNHLIPFIQRRGLLQGSLHSLKITLSHCPVCIS